MDGSKLPFFEQTALNISVVLAMWILASKAANLAFLYLPQSSYIAQEVNDDLGLDFSNRSNQTLLSTDIAKLNLFGEFVEEIIPLSLEPEAIENPVRREVLNLSLIGVFAFADQRRSSAVISINEGSAKVYFVGDKLSEHTELIAIQSDGVIIKNNDMQESVAFRSMPSVNVFPELLTDSGELISRSKSFAETRYNKVSEVKPYETYDNQSMSASEYINLFLSNSPRMRLNLIETELMIEKQTFILQLGFKKNGDNYQVKPDVPEQVRHYFGFEIGDLIVKINDLPVMPTANLISAIALSRKTKRVAITVKRKGKLIKLKPVSVGL